MPKPGDPELNPWIGSYHVAGIDHYGQPLSFFVTKPPPPFYFWLGADAYPKWPIYHGIDSEPR